MMHILAMRFDVYGPGWVVEWTARVATAVVGNDRVLIEEVVGEFVEAIGIASSAGDHEQKWTPSAHFVVEARSRHTQWGVVRRSHSTCFLLRLRQSRSADVGRCRYARKTRA